MYLLHRSGLRTKRLLINRRGDGVHSPYAFDLIRQAVRNPHPYAVFSTLSKTLTRRTSQLRQRHGDLLITHFKDAELIFRLVHLAGSSNKCILLYSHEDSILPHYIQATGKGQITQLITGMSYSFGHSKPTIIIVEDTSKIQLDELTEALQTHLTADGDMMLIWHRANPRLRPLITKVRQRLMPPITFDLAQLEVWVWRPATTHGHYIVFHR